MEYLDLDYSPTGGDLFTVYRVEPAEGKKFDEVAEALAGESSIGTWTEVATMVPEIAEKLRPHIYKISEPYVWIACTAELFGRTHILRSCPSLPINSLPFHLLS
jgi:ribulose-bisphosphate carboxylase large chain